MRRTAVVLALLFVASTFGGFVSSQTPSTITVDGDLSDWSADELMSTSNIDLHLTWDASNLYIGWNGTDWKASTEGADLFIYFNTSSQGSVLSKDWGFSHTLPFAADYGFVLEDDTYFRLIFFDGSAWVESTHVVDLYAGWEGNMVTEFSLPWVELGSPTSLDVMVYAQWQDAGNVWASFPDQNPASNNGAETFTHAWHIENLDNATSPNQLPVIQPAPPNS